MVLCLTKLLSALFSLLAGISLLVILLFITFKLETKPFQRRVVHALFVFSGLAWLYLFASYNQHVLILGIVLIAYGMFILINEIIDWKPSEWKSIRNFYIKHPRFVTVLILIAIGGIIIIVNLPPMYCVPLTIPFRISFG